MDNPLKAMSYMEQVQGGLFSWITLWNLCHALNRCKVTYFHGKLRDTYTMKECQVANFHEQASDASCLCLNGPR